jgi:hemoglobin/transferrin/lactoferrin receptor protein
MRKILIFVLFGGLSFHGYSQIVTIRDRETSEPLEFATLYSENPKATATTNIKGQADISSFIGADRIIIRSLGFKTVTVGFGDLESMTFKLFMERSNINLDEYVVSASRWEQSMRSVPHKITAITPKSVAMLNPQTAADMLGTTGEVFIQKSQQGGGVR